MHNAAGDTNPAAFSFEEAPPPQKKPQKAAADRSTPPAPGDTHTLEQRPTAPGGAVFLWEGILHGRQAEPPARQRIRPG